MLRSFPYFAVLLGAIALTGFTEAATRAQVCKDVKQCIQALDKGKPCKVIRTLDKAIINPFLSAPFELTPLRKGVWQYSDGTYMSLILLSKKHLVMIDVSDSSSSAKPDGSTIKLTDAAEQVLKGVVPTQIDVVYSHEHFDHMGGTGRFFDYMKKQYPRAKFDFWGTESAKRTINNSVTKKAPLPTVLIGKKGRTLSLDKELEVRLDIVGGHAQEDLLVYIPRSGSQPGVVMQVDLVFPKFVPPINLAIAEDVGQLITNHKVILKLDFEVFIGGHFVSGNRRDVEVNLEYMEDLIQAALTAFETVGQDEFNAAGLPRFMNAKAREFGNLWYFLFDVTRAAQEAACYRALLPKWGCRLGGFQNVVHSHCFTALTYTFNEY